MVSALVTLILRLKGVAVEKRIEINHSPKVLELEKDQDGHFRLVITLQKLGVTTKLDFFLDPREASELGLHLHQGE